MVLTHGYWVVPQVVQWTQCNLYLYLPVCTISPWVTNWPSHKVWSPLENMQLLYLLLADNDSRLFLPMGIWAQFLNFKLFYLIGLFSFEFSNFANVYVFVKYYINILIYEGVKLSSNSIILLTGSHRFLYLHWNIRETCFEICIKNASLRIKNSVSMQ